MQNFRNHERTSVQLSQGLNILVGNNAQGKTNFLESIYMLCVGKSFRSTTDRDVIKFEKDYTRVKAIVKKRIGEISAEIVISKIPGKNGKQIKINDIPISKMGELMGTLTCVFFSPDELKLVKEAPSDRRRFMDVDISQIDKNYFYCLLKYNKILKQRNALLKSMSPKPTENELRSLDIWDIELSKVGVIILNRRILFCEELKSKVKPIHNAFSKTEVLDIQYETFVGYENVPRGTFGHGTQSLDFLDYNIFLTALRDSRVNDLRLRTSTVGPHRDDILITVNEKDVRHFASQGQQRTVALSLKIAELKIFESQTGEKPIILFDDVFSELDDFRREKLVKLMDGYQAIVTATEILSCDNIKTFFVSNGAMETR